MKATNKFFDTAIFAAIGLMGIQGVASADNHRNDDRMGLGQPHPAVQVSKANQQNLIDQINDRMRNQRLRIQEGRRTGKLTQNEYANLMREHHEIRQQEHRFLADGFLSPREYATLDRALEKASKQIMFEKHDRDNAYNPPHPTFGGPLSGGR
jgi:hypothetical protein